LGVVDIYSWGGKTDHSVEKWSVTFANGPGRARWYNEKRRPWEG